MTLFEIFLRDAVAGAIERLEQKLKVLPEADRKKLSPAAQTYFSGLDNEIIATIGKLRAHLAEALSPTTEQRPEGEGGEP